jgi:predicted acyltransferase
MATLAATAPAPGSPQPERLVSLDAFRGMTIAGMILVNNPGTWAHVYPPLLHAPWHGWTHTDLVFPFFLFIVGVAMVYSFAGRRARGDSAGRLALHTLRRSAIIVGIGLFLTGFPHFELATWRIPGVLQRIGVCYLFAALLYLYLGRRARVAATAALLVGYWAILALIPAPGAPPEADPLSMEWNIAAWVDRQVMLGHLWKPTWDPEGLLSTLPAIATVLLGVFTGEWLRSERRSVKQKVVGLLVAGAAGLAGGLLWDQWFPINKNLWTSSYVIFTAGYALVVLGACVWLIDVRRWQKWSRPFVIYGMNAIAIYTLSGLIEKSIVTWAVPTAEGSRLIKTWIFQTLFAPLASPMTASLLYAVTYVLFTFLIAWALYRRRIFIKI